MKNAIVKSVLIVFVVASVIFFIGHISPIFSSFLFALNVFLFMLCHTRVFSTSVPADTPDTMRIRESVLQIRESIARIIALDTIVFLIAQFIDDVSHTTFALGAAVGSICIGILAWSAIHFWFTHKRISHFRQEIRILVSHMQHK